MKIFFSEPSSHTEHLVECNTQHHLITSYNREVAAEIEKINRRYGEDFLRGTDLIVDSGAFSIAKKKRRGQDVEAIDIDGYIEKCKDVEDRYRNFFRSIYYISLDEIPPLDHTFEELQETARIGYENYLYIGERLGYKKVLPVLHRYEDLSYLPTYEKYTNYICLGPVGPNYWIYDAFMRKKKSTKIHGLAVTGYILSHLFPWYSVDSTSWQTPGRFGTSRYHNGYALQKVRLIKGNIVYGPGEGSKRYSVNVIPDEKQIENGYYSADILPTMNWHELMVNLMTLGEEDEKEYRKGNQKQVYYQIKTFQKMEEMVAEYWDGVEDYRQVLQNPMYISNRDNQSRRKYDDKAPLFL